MGGYDMGAEQRRERYLHNLMAVIGGFFGGYAILNRCDILGSAQTANLLSMTLKLLGGDLREVLIRLGAAALYACAIALSILVPEYLGWDLQRFSIACTAAVSMLLGVLPAEMDPVLGLYPIFFVMALQWCAFKGCGKYVSSTIFSTNNYRQTIQGVTRYCITKRREELEQTKFFGLTLCSFHLGVALSYPAHLRLGVRSAWLCLPLLAAAGALARRRHGAERAAA